MPKGQKTCSKCGTNTGPRAFNCPKCGESFNIQRKQSAPEIRPEQQHSSKGGITSPGGQDNTPSTLRRPGVTYIIAPGKNPNSPGDFCPVKLKSRGEGDIKDWLENLVDYSFEDCGRINKYSKAAIRYFVDYEIPSFGKNADTELNKKVLELVQEMEIFEV